MKGLTKKEKMSINKEKLIDMIVDDLQNNEYDSRGYIYDLVREALRTRTQADLKQIISGE